MARQSRHLQKNENRTYFVKREESKRYATGEVILAFPLDLHSVPILDNQSFFVQSLKVLCEDGMFCCLESTFLPVKSQREIYSEYAVEFEGKESGCKFPWLQLEEPLTQDRPPEWEMLATDLGLGYPKTDIEFLLTILNWMAEMHETGEVGVAAPMRNLYCALQSKVDQFTTGKDDRKMATRSVKFPPLPPCFSRPLILLRRQ